MRWLATCAVLLVALVLLRTGAPGPKLESPPSRGLEREAPQPGGDEPAALTLSPPEERVALAPSDSPSHALAEDQAQVTVALTRSGEPVSGVRATRVDGPLVAFKDGVLGGGRTGRTGRFTFTGPPDEEVELALTERGRSDSWVLFFSLPGPGEGSVEEIELEPITEKRTRFVVSDRVTGHPVPDASVELTWGFGEGLRAKANAQGVVSVPMDASARYWTTAPGYFRDTRKLEDDAAVVEITLLPFARLHGVVTLPADQTDPGQVEVTLRGGAETSLEVFEVAVDPDGTWSVEDLKIEAGERKARVNVQWKTAPLRRTLALGVDLAPGEQRLIPDPWAKLTPFQLCFNYPDGSAVAPGTAGRLECFEPDATAQFEIGADGWAHTAPIGAGEWTWELGALRGPIDMSLGSRQTIVLEGHGFIAGTLPRYTHESKTRDRVLAKVGGVGRLGPSAQCLVSASGGFRIDGLPVGEEVDLYWVRQRKEVEEDPLLSSQSLINAAYRSLGMAQTRIPEGRTSVEVVEWDLNEDAFK